ncbi:MAG TPA: hypothetical protein PK082_06325, partial [Phycisphaerae bacterium]|nr:hypothetical protein [Phycisphaerae bacterium]
GDNPRDVPYLAAVAGFCLALKLTGAVFLAPLAAIFLLRRWRCLRVGNVAAGLVLFCLPAAMYAAFAWRETGNPVFWMFNEVFRSDFFLTINFRDTRWGPRGWLETLAWPVWVLFRPDRFSELVRCSGRLAMLAPLVLAWAASAWALRKNSPPVPRRLGWLLAGTLLSALGWSATTGYCRYAIFPEMLTGVLTVWLAWRLLARRRLRAVAVGLVLILAAQCAAAGYHVFVRNMDWAWREFYSLKHKQFHFARQWRLVGRDRDSGIDAREVGAWINPCASSGYAVLLRPDVPMLGLECANFSPAGRKVFEQRLAALGDAPLYAAVESDSFDDAVRALDRFAFRIVEKRPIGPRFVSPGRRVLLMRLTRDPARTGED